jgi:exodeoxyribonuclease V alpha subunit
MSYPVGNYVENLVDNSEDNCVENQQDLKSQVPQWIESWSKYVLTQYSTANKLDEDALELVQEILLASIQGDSCISLQAKKIDVLGSLVVDADAGINTVAPFVQEHEFLYLYRYWQLEQRLAQQIKRLSVQPIAQVDVSVFDELLIDPDQKAALAMVADHAFSMITGGPGTGKTYTLARIIAVLHQSIPDIRIAMAAPTGKAAQRMGEALQKSLSDPKLQGFGLSQNLFNPMTLHRLLGLGNHQTPRFNQRQPLPYDVVVVDEASMLDLNLATMLFEAIPEHGRLILLGDANQLASVDVGAVLADLQQMKVLLSHRVNLKTSQRFKEGALIGKMAKFIQKPKDQSLDSAQHLSLFEHEVVAGGELKQVNLVQGMQDIVQLEYLPEKIAQADLARYYKKLSLGFQTYFQSIGTYLNTESSSDQTEAIVQAFDTYRILTAVRHGVLGLNSLNQEMEKALFEDIPTLFKLGDWYIGRPVMMTYNDYQLGLSNGDIGICLKHRQQIGQFEVYFPSLDKWFPATRLPKTMQTAFALTIHKSQGSEFTHTAVVLDAAATRLLSQELIYTAITRAKSVVSLLVDQSAFTHALNIATTRVSGLVSMVNA